MRISDWSSDVCSSDLWPGREDFIRVQLPAGDEADPADRVLIDGAVLANAPFRPAIAALKQRPARREIDRRFIYIDPKPDYKAISIGEPGEAIERGQLPGFLPTILGSLSALPREDRKSVVSGKRGSVRVDLGCRRQIKKK